VTDSLGRAGPGFGRELPEDLVLMHGPQPSTKETVFGYDGGVRAIGRAPRRGGVSSALIYLGSGKASPLLSCNCFASILYLVVAAPPCPGFAWSGALFRHHQRNPHELSHRLSHPAG